MVIREARASDFQAIAEVCAAAFMDEECEYFQMQQIMQKPRG